MISGFRPFHHESNHAKYFNKGFQGLSVFLPYVEEREGGDIMLATQFKVSLKDEVCVSKQSMVEG